MAATNIDLSFFVDAGMYYIKPLRYDNKPLFSEINSISIMSPDYLRGRDISSLYLRVTIYCDRTTLTKCLNDSFFCRDTACRVSTKKLKSPTNYSLMLRICHRMVPSLCGVGSYFRHRREENSLLRNISYSMFIIMALKMHMEISRPLNYPKLNKIERPGHRPKWDS